MFDHNHYVPILKGRDGEYGALKAIENRFRERLTPLIEISPIPWDFSQKKPSKSIDDHLKKVCTNISRAWGTDSSLFLDTLWLPEGAQMKDGTHPMAFLMKSGAGIGLKLIPVAGLLKSPEHIESCQNVHADYKSGVCVRIQREDFEEYSDLAGALKSLLRSLAITIQQVDLLLDLKGVESGEINEVEIGKIVKLVNRIPWLQQWRTFTVAATSFPPNLVGLPPSDCSKIQRLEWGLWKALLKELPTNTRKPAFGDYGISHPEPSEVDPRIMKPSASIRYTYRSYWLVIKARNLKDHGYAQFHNVCKQLVGRSEYCGTDFSWGDEYIDECGSQRVGPGNLTTWRKVGTSHHIAFVLDQLSNFVAS